MKLIKLIALALLLTSTACERHYGMDGAPGINGTNGIDGTNGGNGSDGQNGRDGSSCTVTQLSNGAYIECEDGSHATVYYGHDGRDGVDGENGEDGQDGENGQDAIIEVIDPCGTQSRYDEVLLRLSDGLVYGVYADLVQNKVHLVQLGAGSYTTTDNTSCHFSVDSDNNVSW